MMTLSATTKQTKGSLSYIDSAEKSCPFLRPSNNFFFFFFFGLGWQ
jgi:hypothetical protein